MKDAAKTPYRALGRYLRSLREDLGMSAKEFWARHQETLGIVYGRFAAIERGEALPDLPLLQSIARCLGLNERVAYLRWLALQLPAGEDQEFFLGLEATLQKGEIGSAVGAKDYEIRSNSIPPSEFDNTWVLGPSDLRKLEADIELFDLLVLLEITWPAPQGFEQFGFEDQKAWLTFKEDYLQPWIDEGRLAWDEQTRALQLALPHFHLPKTEQWMEFRRRIVNRFVHDALPQLTPQALQARKVFRTFTSRLLSERQVQQFVDRLPAIEKEFFSAPIGGEEKAPRQGYSLLILLAERDLKMGRRSKKTGR